MFHAVISYWGIVCLWVLSIPHIYLAGALLPLAIVAIDITGDDREPGLIARALNRLAILGLVPIFAFAGNWAVAVVLTQSHLAGLGVAWKYTASLAASLALTFALLRFLPQQTNKLSAKLTAHTSLERNKKTDIRNIEKLLPKSIGQYDPEKFWTGPTDLKKIFVGKDEHKQPIYYDYEAWKISHVLLTGRSRSGKGVVVQSLMSQAIMKREFGVVLDPKIDNYMPHIFKKVCDEHNLPYRFININQGQPPQINIFEHCCEHTAQTIESLLIGALGLTPKGTDADFYRLEDRAAARQVARWVAANPGKTPRDCVAALGDTWEECKSFAASMRDLADVPAINRPCGTGGVSIYAGEQEGGLLYVCGDMINTTSLIIQRMIMLHLLFRVKNRDQLKPGRTICVLADEFRVHISPAFMVSLGASAGWGLHTILAMQSFSDLANVPGDLDKEAVKGSVCENTTLKICYSISDGDTVDEVAKATGVVQVDDESRRVSRGMALSERVEADRTIRQSERFHFDSNMLRRMPKGCAAFILPDALTRFCFTAPVNAGERTRAAITPTVAPMPESAASAATGSVAAAMLALDDLPATPEEIVNEEPYPDFEHAELAKPAGGALDLD